MASNSPSKSSSFSPEIYDYCNYYGYCLLFPYPPALFVDFPYNIVFAVLINDSTFKNGDFKKKVSESYAKS